MIKQYCQKFKAKHCKSLGNYYSILSSLIPLYFFYSYIAGSQVI